MLVDNHNRKINYLRLAVTDRCNLRCNYCMPESGINFAPRSELLSLEELQQVAQLLVSLGIDKIRITGGEPFVRKDIMTLFRALSTMDGLREISVTTNGTLLRPHIDELKALGIRSVNLSMDAIQAETFHKITRRDNFKEVYDTLMELLEKDFEVRINFIVLNGQNIEDIYPIMALQEEYPVRVRFLEEMPFNGGSRDFKKIHWDHKRILSYLQQRYPNFEKIPAPMTATAVNYKIPGHRGSFGIIPSFSRTFCGSCNRLRLTATGDLITCLYGKPVANLREALRGEFPEVQTEQLLRSALGSRAKDGFEAQEKAGGIFGSSMTSIGG